MLDNFDEIEREPKIITYEGHFPEEIGWKEKHKSSYKLKKWNVPLTPKINRIVYTFR